MRQHYPVSNLTTGLKTYFPEQDQRTHNMASLHLFQEHICYIFIFILIIKNTQWYKETYKIRTCGETDIYPVDVFIVC